MPGIAFGCQDIRPTKSAISRPAAVARRRMPGLCAGRLMREEIEREINRLARGNGANAVSHPRRLAVRRGQTARVSPRRGKLDREPPARSLDRLASARSHQPGELRADRDPVLAAARGSGAVDRRLEACLAVGDDPLLAPLRIAWLPPEKGGQRVVAVLRPRHARRPARPRPGFVRRGCSAIRIATVSSWPSRRRRRRCGRAGKRAARIPR